MLGEMGSLLKTLTLRIAQGFCVVGITAALALGIPRWAHPELYPDEQGWGGLAHAMRRAFFHFDFGVACGWVGCPSVHDMWLRGYAADVWMLFGTVAIGVGAGFALGLWCAGRADSRRARVVEGAAVVLYCTPAYVLALGVLLLFIRRSAHCRCRTSSTPRRSGPRRCRRRGTGSARCSSRGSSPRRRSRRCACASSLRWCASSSSPTPSGRRSPRASHRGAWCAATPVRTRAR